VKIQFFLENNHYGRGSANLKAQDKPLLQVDLPTEPGNYMEIDGVWYSSVHSPSYHYLTGALDHIEFIIRPNGGEAERKWHLNIEPFHSEHLS
jgi:hypothetical protein